MMESKHGRTDDGELEEERGTTTVAPGRRTLTARLPPSPEGIAAAILRRLRAGSHGPSAAAATPSAAAPSAATPSAATAPEDPLHHRASRRGDVDPFGVHLAPGGDVDAIETDEHIAAGALADPGEPLAQRSELERAFGGHDLGGIEVHRGPGTARALRRLGAEGFAAGEHVALAPGARLHTVVHEVVHVIQQRAGLVGSPDASERAADEIASLVVARQPVAHLLPSPARAPVGVAASVVQLAELGQRPAGADPNDPRFLPSAPADTVEGMLFAMQAYALARAQELADQLESTPAGTRPELEKQRDHFKYASYLTVDRSHVRLFDTTLKPRESLAAPARMPSDGYYETDPSGNLAMAGFKGGRFDFGVDPKNRVAARLADWLAPDQIQKLRIALGGDTLMLIGVRADAANAGPSGTVAGWANAQVAAVTKELEASDGNGGSGSAGKPGDAVPKEAPPKLVAWARGEEMWVNVWLEDYGYGKPGHERAIRLQEGKATEALLAEVKEAAAALRDARDRVKGPTAAKKTGFVDAKDLPKYDDQAFPGEAREINAPAYGAELTSYGLPSPAVTVLGATNRFAMELDFAAAGSDLLSQVTARMQLIHYHWELIELDAAQLARLELDSDQRDKDGAADAATDKAATDKAPKPKATKEEVASEVAVGDRTRTDEVDPFSGIGQDLKRKMRNIGTDTSANVRDATSRGMGSWPAQSAWLGVVGLSAAVRSLGAVVYAIGDMLTVPLNEHSIGFTKPGTFLLRCVATPEPGSNVVRAPSVRVMPIKVVDLKTRAVEANNADLATMDAVEKQLAAATAKGDDETAAKLGRALKALRSAGAQTVEQLASRDVATDDDKLAIIENIEAAQAANVPDTEWPKDARWSGTGGGVEKMGTKMQILWRGLQLEGQSLASEKERTVAHRTGVKQMGDRATKVRTNLGVPTDKTFRPHVSLASEENGQVMPVMMTLADVGSDQERHWVLIDLTTDKTAATGSHAHGKSAKAGPAGHSEAITQAFKKFAESHEYGRGTLAIRLPAEVLELTGGAASVPATLRCEPGERQRVMQCLSDLALVAGIAGLFVGGGVGAAIAIAGDLAGAVTSVDRLARHGFHWDLETAMDVLAVIGPVATRVTPALPALGRAGGSTAVARKVGNAIHIFGLAQAAGQMLVIPYELLTELQEIEGQKDLSPGEKAARQLQALLGAAKSGLLAVGALAQMHEGPRIGEKQHRPPASGEHAAPHEAAPAGTSARQQALQGIVEQSDLGGKKVRVVERSSLEGDHTQVRDAGDEILIEVGPKANADNVRDHLATARYYDRFRGVLGKIQTLIDHITSLISGDPAHGTRGREASLEVNKLDKILQRLQGQRAEIQRFVNEVLGRADTSEATSAIDRKITAIEKQLDAERALVASHEPGRGLVASKNTETVDSIIVLLQKRPEHLKDARNVFEASLGTVRVNGMVDVPVAAVEQLLGGARGAVEAAKAPAANDLAALLDATLALSRAGDRAKLLPEQRRVLETLADTYHLRFADRGGLTRAGEDPAKIAHMQKAYPVIAQHGDSTKVFHYSDNANGLGNEYNGTTFWQTEKPNDHYWARYLTESTMGALREISVGGEVRLDEKATGQTHPHDGQALVVIHKPGHHAVPGEVTKAKVAGETRTGDPVFDPGDPKYVEPEHGWMREGTREFVDPSEDAAKHEVEEKLAKAYKIKDGKARAALEAIHRRSKQDGKQLVELLKACRDQPGLVDRLLATYGDATLGHVTPNGDGTLSIHGEVELAPSQLAALGDADLARLVELARTRHGDEAAYARFEATAAGPDAVGLGLRFRSRVRKRAGETRQALLDGAGIPADDARAKLFDAMSPGDERLLWDLQGEPAYQDAARRKQAAEAAFAKSPKSVAELVGELRAQLQQARHAQLAARKAAIEAGKVEGTWTAAEEAELRGLKIEQRPHLYVWAWAAGGKQLEIRRVANYEKIAPDLPQLRVAGDKIVEVDAMKLNHADLGPTETAVKGEGTTLPDLAQRREGWETRRDVIQHQLEGLCAEAKLTADEVEAMAKTGELAIKHPKIAEVRGWLNQAKHELNKATEKYGEEGARSFMRQAYGSAPREVYTGFTQGQLDQIWKVPAGTKDLRTGKALEHDRYVVIEAKGGESGLGARVVDGELYQQGTKKYLQSVVDRMRLDLAQDPARLFEPSVRADPAALATKRAELTATLAELEAAIHAGGDAFDYLKVQTPVFRDVLSRHAADYPKIRKFILE